MFHFKRLRDRLITWVIGGVFIVLILITATTYVVVRNALQDEVQQRVLNLVQTKVGTVDGFFREVGKIPVVLASASAVDQENDEMLLRARIREVLNANPAVYGSTVAFEPYTFYPTQKYFSPYYSRTEDWEGLNYVQLGSDDYVYFRDWEWYTGPRSTSGLYWSLPYFDEGAGNIWMVTASYPVYRDGKFTAVATVDVPIDDIKESVAGLSVGDKGYTVMFDRTGGIVAASGIPGLEEGASIYNWITVVNEPEVGAVFDAVLSNKEGVAAVPDAVNREKRAWAIYTSIPSTDWHVVTFVSVSEMLAPVTTISLGILGISMVGLMVLIILISFASNTITRPIETLRAEAAAIAGGDFARRVPVETDDEIGAMSQAFNRMTEELESLVTGLEQRVAERTHGLQAAAEVSRATTSIRDLDKLLPQVVDLILERFELYYAGLFLLDEAREFAVLRAGTGAAGEAMLARGHRLRAGGDSMIGLCVSRDQARIALDVGEEAVRFNNPFLPDTHSEMALPLHSHGQVIGALSVQSSETAAFDEADIAVIQTMADQVAAAIDNARLFAETQATLQDMETLQRRYLGQAWESYLQEHEATSYETARPGAALDDLSPSEAQVAVVRRDATVLTNKGETGVDYSSLVAPILLRGEVIGVLGLQDDASRQWSNDEIALVKSIIEQMSLAAENLRLLDETQRRATREQIVARVTARMRETLDVDAVLQAAVREMGEAMGVHDLAIQLELDDQDEDHLQ